MFDHNGEVRLLIQADLDEIPGVSAMIGERMRVFGFPEEEILDMQLAVEECIVNTILHGYRGKGGEVAITVQTTTRSTLVRIEDQAPPFDPLSVPEPDIDTDLTERHVGGLGIYLMRRVVDEARYQYLDGKNILTLIKRKSL